MMRSNMPQQIHQGVGSLSGIARGMFMGGEVGGHPLDQYGQYLTQTYAQPIQQSAQGAVDRFVNSVREKEQTYFGSQMGGGGVMGSPMQSPQPGGMQMSQFNALQAQQPATPMALNTSDPYDGMRGFGVMQPGTFTTSPFGNNLGSQQMIGQRRLDAMPSSSVAANQANLANAQFTAPSAPPGATLSDAFASKFGENWADQFSLTTPNNRARLGIV